MKIMFAAIPILAFVFQTTDIQSASASWTVQKETSQIDDSTNVFAIATSDTPVYDRFSRPHTVRAFAVYRENSTHFYLTFEDIFMADSGGFGTVTIRTDKDKARKIDMQESTDHGALGLWNGVGVPFLKSLIGKKSMLVVATPFNESSVDTKFDMSGFESALKEVRMACHW